MLACFNILHYRTAASTIASIQSLLKLDRIMECRILVIDNHSPNDSLREIQAAFDGNPLIEYLVNTENSWFSAGNNLGYAKAKSYDPDFIIEMNNDIEIRQKDFLDVLQKIAAKDKYYVIGPDIYADCYKAHQSPLRKVRTPAEQIWKDYGFDQPTDYEAKAKRAEKQAKKDRWKYRLPFPLVYAARAVYCNLANKGDWYRAYKEEHINPVFSGSFLIFTRNYIAENERMFEPETKFYFEEMLLALKCETLGYKTLYTPQLHVIHDHSVATRASFQDQYSYVKFVDERMREACEIYRKTEKNNPWRHN